METDRRTGEGELLSPLSREQTATYRPGELRVARLRPFLFCPYSPNGVEEMFSIVRLYGGWAGVEGLPRPEM
jgi:hypothetical protein